VITYAMIEVPAVCTAVFIGLYSLRFPIDSADREKMSTPSTLCSSLILGFYTRSLETQCLRAAKAVVSGRRSCGK